MKSLYQLGLEASSQFVTVPATLPEHPELHGTPKSPYKKKLRERKGFWAVPTPKQRKLHRESSGGGTLNFGKGKTIPKPSVGNGQANFLQTVAEYRPMRKGLKAGQKRRDKTPQLPGRAPEVVERDAKIRTDRKLVAIGLGSQMVKIVKRSKVLTATLGELAEVSAK